MKTPNFILSLACSVCLVCAPGLIHAADLTASDGAVSDYFGQSVSQSGSIGLVGAFIDTVGINSYQGSAYVFRSLDTATGTITQNVKLTASDGATLDRFGIAVSLSGSIGLVGAYSDDIGANNNQGSAYVFRSLDTATGAITQNVKLIASDGAASDAFGFAVSQSGSIGLVGAYADIIGPNSNQGSAYVFRSLDTATGTITENVKLTASDGSLNDFFGIAVSQSGSIGLVGASYDDTAKGSAYVFRNLDTATGTITQNVKLTASDGELSDEFGDAVSLSGSIGLVGVYRDTIGANVGQGSAYVFRSLDTATGTITENVKLTASDGTEYDNFGESVSLSGSTGLVGASYDDVEGNGEQGSAYLFRNLNTATGTLTENVKLTASDGAASNFFGVTVGVDGDQFVIGANGKNANTGKAYSGSVASVTTLDTGSTSKTISGISFISQDDWIIGETTDSNQVTLSAGDSANVTAVGKAVHIGKNAGSDNNTLIISGTLTANAINVGAAGNTGNKLVINGSVSAPLTVASGSTLGGSGTVGALSGAGTIAPGNSPGILTSNGTINPSGGLDYIFEFSQFSINNGLPVYGNPTASINDIMRLTLGSNPFTTALTNPNNEVTVNFTGATPVVGQVYLGGFYTDSGNYFSSIQGAKFNYTGLGAGQAVTVSMIQNTANFGAGNINGYVTRFEVVAVPEPGRALLLTVGLAGMLLRRRRSRSEL